MPIGSGDAYAEYLNRYEQIIKPAVEGLKIDGEQAFRCTRADLNNTTGSITQDVLSELYRADAVIADLTDLNPNVFYELGVRHALRSGTILMALKSTKPPFDVGDLRVIYYEDRVGAEKNVIPRLQSMLLGTTDPAYIDSPVLRAVPDLAAKHVDQEQQAKIAALEQEASKLRTQLSISEMTNLSTQAAVEQLRSAIDSLTARLPAAQQDAAKRQVESEVTKAPRLKTGRAGRSQRSKSNLIFVVMPFTKQMNAVYATISHAASAMQLRTLRADEIAVGGSIIDQVFEMIVSARLVIADLSGRNQNVMYEVGLANAMKRDVLLLSQSMDDVAFDVRNQRVLLYKATRAGLNTLEQQLLQTFGQYQTTSRRKVAGALTAAST